MKAGLAHRGERLYQSVWCNVFDWAEMERKRETERVRGWKSASRKMLFLLSERWSERETAFD